MTERRFIPEAVGSLVLCPRLGKEEFEITRVHDRTKEYTLRSTVTNKQTDIYQVHCHVPADMRNRNTRLRINAKRDRAAQVGNPTPKKKF